MVKLNQQFNNSTIQEDGSDMMTRQIAASESSNFKGTFCFLKITQWLGKIAASRKYLVILLQFWIASRRCLKPQATLKFILYSCLQTVRYLLHTETK